MQADQAIISYGGGDVDYAGVHYFTRRGKALKHVMKGEEPISLSNAVSAPDTGRRSSGTATSRYGKLYRQAKKQGKLSVLYSDGLKWLERAIAEPKTMKKIFDVFLRGGRG